MSTTEIEKAIEAIRIGLQAAEDGEVRPADEVIEEWEALTAETNFRRAEIKNREVKTISHDQLKSELGR